MHRRFGALLGLGLLGALLGMTGGALAASPYHGRTHKVSTSLIGAEAYAKAHPRLVRAQVAAGVAAFDAHQPSIAVRYYDIALRLAPRDAVVMTDLANVYRESLREPRVAVRDYLAAAQMNGRYDEAWYGAISTALSIGADREAVSVAARALRSLPAKDALRGVIAALSAQAKAALSHPAGGMVFVVPAKWRKVPAIGITVSFDQKGHIVKSESVPLGDDARGKITVPVPPLRKGLYATTAVVAYGNGQFFTIGPKPYRKG